MDEHKQELISTSTKCARAVLRIVDQQLANVIANAQQHIRTRSEAWEIGSRQHAIESALELFERVHDDGIKSFYAYISAPASSDLLREHGFVGFDESGDQAVRTESVNALRCSAVVAVHQMAEKCKQQLRQLEKGEPREPGRVERDEARPVDGTDTDADMDDQHFEYLEAYIVDSCQSKLDTLVAGLSKYIEEYEEEVSAEQERFAMLKHRIWKARAAFAGRIFLVGGVLVLLGGILSQAAPQYFGELLGVFSQDLLDKILVGAASTVMVLLMAYIVTGSRNRNVRRALRPILFERLKSYSKRKSSADALRASFEECYDKVIDDVKSQPLELDKAVARGVVRWLTKHAQSYQKKMRELEALRELIRARSGVIDEYINVVNERLDEIPKQLQDASDNIKKGAIEEHLGRIRTAAEAVERVRVQVQIAADIAMPVR